MIKLCFLINIYLIILYFIKKYLLINVFNNLCVCNIIFYII